MVSAAGTIGLGGKILVAAEILAGRRVGVRIEASTLMLFDLDTRELLRTRSNPLTPAQVLRLRVLPLVNTEYREPLFGWEHAQFAASAVAGVSDLTDADLARWRADLAACSARGAYVHVTNLYVCLGRA